jgi:hypothetical protein
MRKQVLGVFVLAAALVTGAIWPASGAEWLSFLGLGSDFHTYLEDARGLQPGAAIEWRGLAVGSVTTVRPVEGRIRVDGDLAREYRKGIPGAVKAWARVDLLTRKTALRLIDVRAKDESVLGRGAEVPAAAWHEAVTKRDLSIAGGILVGLALVLLILKGLKKLIFILVVGGVIVGGSIWVRNQWGAAHAREESRNDYFAEADRLIEQLRQSPGGAAVAEKIQGALKHAAERVREEGPSAWQHARAEIDRLLQTESATLREDGQGATADVLGRLKALVGNLLPGKSPPEE